MLGFSDGDKIGTIQSHDDALVVILKIGGYDVKRVLVDQGSVVKVMYPNLYRGSNLKPKDLPLEKAILAMVQATRKLPHYFQAHTVIVLT